MSRDCILYLNFFDDRLRHLQRDGLAMVLDAYFSLYPEKKNAETVYCFFDEIQVVPGWENFVDRLMRTEKCEVFITGSSAQMLSREIATQMRGLLVEDAFNGYFEAGGFPEVADLSQALRIKIHQEYWGAMLFRDLVERHDVAHPRAVTDLGHWLVDNLASLYSVNRLTGYLKSIGHRVPKSAVSDYLTWFEDAFFLFTVRVFDASVSRANVNPKKIYCVDHGLVTSVASGILVNSGHLLENLVFVALRRVAPDIHYYKSKAEREVDFVVEIGGGRRLVQVCESLVDPRTRKRELLALRDAMAELSLDTAEIVVKSGTSSEEIEVETGTIRVVPAWRFLLDLS